MVLQFSKKQFLELGIIMGGNWSDSQIQQMSMKDKEGHFRDRFYAHPRTFREMYRDIQHPDLGERCIKKPNAWDFLSAFYFLKVYPTEKSLAGFPSLMDTLLQMSVSPPTMIIMVTVVSELKKKMTFCNHWSN
eukprot:scaffold8546_cov73-Cylindrotheca_fusiformis.AAC.2